ncbi:L-lactate permease [Nocardioides sp. DS6]|uniref:L-lactate permease n=1 Tax=Nocardioides eburneus TaxID=3231482 RepID=A0ABV3SWM4_9ACTN
MFQQDLDPVGGSLGLSALCAAIPLLVLFVLLGGLRMRAWLAGIIALVVSLVVAVAAFDMPTTQALLAGSEGAAYGFFPILWIVVNAIWVYNLTVATGHFAVLQRTFAKVSPDQRIQAIIVAFCFGALLEALAGFGTPVAITVVMLMALGFKPLKAAVVALVANTAPVAFGAMAVPITTLSSVAMGANNDPRLDVDTLGSMVGRQTPILAVIVPLFLVLIVDGRRGLAQTWLPALVTGLAFGVGQFVSANFVSVTLADIVASLFSALVLVGFLRVWHTREVVAPTVHAPVPRGGDRVVVPDGVAMAGSSIGGTTAASVPGRTGRTGRAGRSDGAGGGRRVGGTPDAGSGTGGAHAAAAGTDGAPGDSRRDVLLAYAPYAVIIVLFVVTNITAVKEQLAKEPWTHPVHWPGLNVLNTAGDPVSTTTFALNWLPAAGTILLISGLITTAILRITPTVAARTYVKTYVDLRSAIITVMAVLGLAYTMNLSGQTASLGSWLAGAGGAFAVISPVLGWIGVAVTGSDTSSNALFGALQVQTASKAGLDPLLMAAANSSGGVLGKMISPQNLAIAAAAVGLGGREGDIFRRVVGWSLVMIAFMCALVGLQATGVLAWMVP